MFGRFIWQVRERLSVNRNLAWRFASTSTSKSSKRFVERRSDSIVTGEAVHEVDADYWSRRALEMKAKAKALGLGPTFISSADSPDAYHRDAYLEWIKEGMEGTMGYLSRPDRIERRLDLQRVLPGVKSVIITSLLYWPGRAAVEAANKDPTRGAFASYAWGKDYHYILPDKLRSLAEWIHSGEKKDGGSSRWYVDTGAVLERSFGERVGMGFIGKNSMLINPRYGSGFVMGEILTTLPFPSDDISVTIPKSSPKTQSEEATGIKDIDSTGTKKMQAGCGKCRKCIVACPTGAIVNDRVVDSRKCISYLTIEHRGDIPIELRSKMGNKVFGCDICQAVCPWNKFEWEDELAKKPNSFSSPLFGKVGLEYAAPKLKEILRMTEVEFEEKYNGTAVMRVGLKRLKRNAVIALGNSGDPNYIDFIEAEVLSKRNDPNFDSKDANIIKHAEWAKTRLETVTLTRDIPNADDISSETQSP